MKLYFILIEAARMISTAVIMIIITIAICVFSSLLFFSPLALQMIFFAPRTTSSVYFTQDAKPDLIVGSMRNLVD